ncbi:hypothetical protein [Streptomyces sp. NPDC052042]|uniref:hypothetical protein n=1 Tax=Streptomyces sp. NPDC052042 TaxID=3365683 RepID=UPI0037D56E84
MSADLYDSEAERSVEHVGDFELYHAEPGLAAEVHVHRLGVPLPAAHRARPGRRASRTVNTASSGRKPSAASSSSSARETAAKTRSAS